MNPSNSQIDTLPDVFTAPLSGEQLTAYLAELAATASDVSIRTRGGAPQESIAALARAFESHQLDQAQLRYCRDGARWIDTLIRRPGEIELVRMQG